MMRSITSGLVGAQSIAVLLVFSFSAAALAGTTTYSGDTTGDPTWNRTVALSGSLSGIGTAVSYETQMFCVSLSGNYTITSDYDGNAAYDGYLHLYEISFDPLDPCTNLLADGGRTLRIGLEWHPYHLRASEAPSGARAICPLPSRLAVPMAPRQCPRHARF